jgi:O-acetyl-ADP-ribose deacetylase (regulator of RNase III)
LKARYVIHTVGPVWNGGDHGEAELLASAYRNSLKIAASKGIRTIAFPSISTGAYRFPVTDAARIAIAAVIGCLGKNDFDRVRFVLFSHDDLEIYARALEEIG